MLPAGCENETSLGAPCNTGTSNRTNITRYEYIFDCSPHVFTRSAGPRVVCGDLRVCDRLRLREHATACLWEAYIWFSKSYDRFRARRRPMASWNFNMLLDRRKFMLGGLAMPVLARKQ